MKNIMTDMRLIEDRGQARPFTLGLFAAVFLALTLILSGTPRAQSLDTLDLTPLQEPVQDAPQQPPADPGSGQGSSQVLPSKVFKDWAVRCEVLPGAEGEGCYMYQDVINQGTGQPMVQLAVGLWPPEKVRGLIVTTPLGVFLPPGMILVVDGQERGRLQFVQCIPTGCQAHYQIADDILQVLKGGNKGELRLRDGQGRAISIPYSLSGFTAAYAELK